MSNLLNQIAGLRIKAVASMTGLSTHVIRKWEERYDLLHPRRESNAYRIYTEEEIQLLLYVKSQLAQGESIGELSQAGIRALRRSMKEDPISLSGIPQDYQEETLRIVQSAQVRDVEVIQRILTEWITPMGLEQALDTILFPVLRLIGELWHEGRISISSEHAVTRLIRQHLVTALRSDSPSGQAHAIIACAPGEYHEIAPLTAAFLLQNRGWQTIYLGSNVAFDVLALALRRSHANLMILSCTTEPGRKIEEQWLKTLRKRFQPHCQVMVGGAGFSAYTDLLTQYEIAPLRHMRDVTKLDPKYYVWQNQSSSIS
ncbi:MAG: MerR family transcriptional regulator [Nitrospirales bacterium]